MPKSKSEVFNVRERERVITASGTRKFGFKVIGTLEIDLSELSPKAEAKARKVLEDL